MFQIAEGHTVAPVERVRVHGRFLFAGDEKFFIKGVTYGPFPNNQQGDPLPEREQVVRDFEMMRAAGVNTLRVYYVPSRWFLDLAHSCGLRVVVGIPWPQHLCFLDQWEVKEQIKGTIRKAVQSLAGHPALLAWLVGNEIPAHIVRWHGAQKIEKFLAKLTAIVREEDPTGLVSYANYPSTEYLRLPFLDFLSFNVYLHEEKAFRGYLKRLQNLAGDLPLVLSEFGMDSIRHSEAQVAETLAWQLRAGFELGVSGTMVFAWTDEWFTGGQLVEDWAFGLVDAGRRPKPAYDAVAEVYRQRLPLLPAEIPFISVVVCAYNAESTMEGCLASFRKLDYPHFEVIVVNDGSTDSTGSISDRHAAENPHIRVIHQPNLGLSAARNVGMHAAQGEIVAYTDSDCYVDPDWLTYMAWAFTDKRFVAVGGPNLPPPEDNRTSACVAVSPGAPTHVLLTDEVAEHIPGCNMAYRKEKLMEINGFDATYRAAGDDVDVCWRLQDRGYVIGFCAAMMVWHHRRNTVSAYIKQQKGYGRSEALLLPKHKERFNSLGNSRWAGRIYGDIGGCLLTSRPVIYHGAFGMGLFQTLYEPKGSLLAYLPLSLEWMSAAVALLMAAFFLPFLGLAGLGMLLTTLAFAGHRAGKAKLPTRHNTLKSRLIIVGLTLVQPICRGWTRYRTVLQLRNNHCPDACAVPLLEDTPHSLREMPHVGFLRRVWELVAVFSHRLTFQHYFWNNNGVEREKLLSHIISVLNGLHLPYSTDTGFASISSVPPWDLQARVGLWTTLKLRVTTENHGGNKRFVRLAGSILPTWHALLLLAALGLVAVLQPLPTPVSLGVAVVSGLFAAWVALGFYRAASLVTMLTQYLIVRTPGGSREEPKAEVKAEARAKVKAPTLLEQPAAWAAPQRPGNGNGHGAAPELLPGLVHAAVAGDATEFISEN